MREKKLEYAADANWRAALPHVSTRGVFRKVGKIEMREGQLETEIEERHGGGNSKKGCRNKNWENVGQNETQQRHVGKKKEKKKCHKSLIDGRYKDRLRERS